ncbi:hypothetical protein GcM3_082042 [Golovinomyces cichoracearum]|uniref:Uncharacterized protein n=1 Tax=Golovinomyces cichoracearum TaxID=62708 RepID=A0A420IMQ6_9PEZI|nr:hypothetical protein GcM3_082042 [Golovinomyces cichoracearum]
METVGTRYLLVEAGEEDDHEELIAITYEQAKKGANMLELYLLRHEGTIVHNL